MLILQNISYIHPNKDLLFDDINLSISNQERIALIGNNGIGKSTLLKIMSGLLQPASGAVKTDAQPYYIPQVFGQFNHLTIAEVLQVDDKIKALQEILSGNVSELNLAILNDDWSIEERCHEALEQWQLDISDLSRKMESLSGGQITKVFLAGIAIHQPSIVLLDEPSNHLDIAGRDLLYEFITSFHGTMIVVSHDRKLLNLLDVVYELRKSGIAIYGGNYDFYYQQKQLELQALTQDVKSKEKALRKAKETARESAERQQKLDARGRKKQEKSGVPTIFLNTLRNNAEKSTSKMKEVHAEKTGNIAQELQDLRNTMPEIDKMKFGFHDATLHRGKILITATNINFGYDAKLLWQRPLSFQVTCGERIVIKGLNGSGKTTLIKMLLGELKPTKGLIQSAVDKMVYIDQEYSLINNQLNVYEQAQQFNHTALQEHEMKIRLNRFLFSKAYWDRPCSALSGGERMRLVLCCLTIANKAPDIILLDEPTNNLDIQNIEILTAAIDDYKGTLIVVSHDQYFLEQIHVEKQILLNG